MTRAALAFVTVALVASCATTSKNTKVDGRRTPPDEPWRATMPPATPAANVVLPAFTEVTLKNGLTVIVVEDHALPTVGAAMVVRAGSAADAPRDAGLAALTWSLLDEGAGSMTGLQLENAFEALGADLVTHVDADYGLVRTELPKEELDKGLELLETVLRKPTFEDAALERLKDEQLTARVAGAGDVDGAADAAAWSLIYGADHAYGHAAGGSAATLDKLTRFKVQHFWAQNAGPKNAALILCGDVTLDEAKDAAEKHFGRWFGRARPPKAPPDPKPRAALSLALVDVPGARQAAMRVGRAALAHGGDDEGALLVLDEILARRTADAAAGVAAASGVEDRFGAGPFLVRATAPADKASETAADLVAQLDAVKSDVKDEEVAQAKEALLGRMPAALGATQERINAAARLFAEELPLDALGKRAASIQSVTADAVKKAAASALVKDDLVVVVAGDKETVLPKLQAEKIADVTVIEPETTETASK